MFHNESLKKSPNEPSQKTKNIIAGVVIAIFLLLFAGCMGSTNKTNKDDSAPAPIASESLTESPTVEEDKPIANQDAKFYNEKIPAERDLKILQYAGSPENKTMRRLTLQEGRALLDSLSEIHPDFYKVRTIGWARSVCGDLLHGKDEAYILKVMPFRFGASETRIIGPNESKAILDVIKANGFCEKP